MDKPTSVYDLVKEALNHHLKDMKIDDIISIDAGGKLSFVLTLTEHDLSFAMLDQIATTFKTKKIEVRHQSRDRMISEVTWESYGVILIEVKSALLPDPPPPPPPPEPPRRGYLLVAHGQILASAWARGRQCQKDEAYYVGSVEEVDHLPRDRYKIVYIGPQSKVKDVKVAQLEQLGFQKLEE